MSQSKSPVHVSNNSNGTGNTIPHLSIEEMDSNELTDSSMFQRRSSSPGSMSQGSQDSCHNDMAVEQGFLQVKVKTSKLERTNSSEPVSGISCYKMDSKPRGYALIFDIEEYANDVRERRVGSHIDATNLHDLFVGLGFKVFKKKNPKRTELLNDIKQFATLPDHKNGDMMILAVLSHGGPGHIVASDGMSVDTELIYEQFNNEKCRLLMGKPKFFIIQACRGEESDKGQIPLAITNDTKRKRNAGTGTDSLPFVGPFKDVDRARPTWEDMVIAYSTIPGYYSYRDHDKGTWFIQSLVEVFMNHAFNSELIDLLRMTSDRLSNFQDAEGNKQTCNVEMRHLYKRIFFNPGFDFDVEPSTSHETKI